MAPATESARWEFHRGMQAAWVRANRPSTRTLARRLQLDHDLVQTAIHVAGKPGNPAIALPTWPITEAIVRQLDGPVELVHSLWEAAQDPVEPDRGTPELVEVIRAGLADIADAIRSLGAAGPKSAEDEATFEAHLEGTDCGRRPCARCE